MINNLEEKPGYKLLESGEPVFNFTTLQELKVRFLALIQGKILDIKNLEFHDYEGVFEIEKACKDAVDLATNCDPELFSEWHEGVLQDSSLCHQFPEFERKQFLALEIGVRTESSGCFLVEKIINKKLKYPILGMAIMEHFLGFCTWEQMNVPDDVNSQMEYHTQVEYDEHKDEMIDTNYKDWRDHSGSVHLYATQEEVETSEVVKAEREWKAAHKKVIDTFHAALKTLDIDLLQRRMNRNDCTAAWLRGIIYLLKNKFVLGQFVISKEEEYCAPPEYCYGFLWKMDEYLRVFDEAINSRYEGGMPHLSFMSFYFKDAAITLNTDKAIACMKVCSYLFGFNPEKNNFEHGDKNIDIPAYLRSLCIDGWQGILHRAIKRYRGKLAKWLEAHE